ncbi:biotin/lipoyl-containing protein [Fonticella tunisiensis]|uniref:Biotin-dependent enzyme n=1 Tax=Fonticella tunisiensis TaxID=1096341 RepID=A0A4R7KSI3_9CLOT|nr:biotin/lipoyl-containing protein [Fonticella tunisiensis]TDT62766.1 biotin-dependent enzyme [Fonticella tunisiensis]
MKKYVIKLNGKVYEVEIEEVTGEVASSTSESVKPVPGNSSAPGSGGETVKAPMPGNILDVYVKVGDHVKRGQVLMILEAMKMENEIVSPVDGKVLSVGVSKGQAVNPGEVLVQIGTII